MSDNIKKKSFAVIYLWIIWIVSIVIIALINYVIVKDNKLNNIKDKQTISKLLQQNTEANLKIKDLQKLKEKINNLKTRDDFLKRDMFLYIRATHRRVPRIVAREISNQIVILSKKYKVSPELILGIIKVESSFNPFAIGAKTKYGRARGLMQVMPEWCPKFGIKQPYDLHNINIGIESGIKVFLIHLKESKGNTSKALFKYVNGDSTYADKVYVIGGKFIIFRNNVDVKEINNAK